jgi:ABC-type branched-subunit amino acid transport system ATPase component
MPSSASIEGRDEPAVIRARGLIKTFGHVAALQGVDLELYGGEVVALLGDNGAGKSTLTKCLCGVYQPDAGELELAGRPVQLRSIRSSAPSSATPSRARTDARAASSSSTPAVRAARDPSQPARGS